LAHGETRVRHLIRKSPYYLNGEYYPAEKTFRVNPATYRKTPTRTLKTSDSSLALKKGETHSFVSATVGFLPNALTAKRVLTAGELSSGGSEIFIKVAATGRKPASGVLQIATSTAVPQSIPVGDPILDLPIENVVVDVVEEEIEAEIADEIPEETEEE